MVMPYRVFDTGIYRLFGVVPADAAAMRLVRNLLSGDGDYPDDLAVSCAADDGGFVQAPANPGAWP